MLIQPTGAVKVLSFSVIYQSQMVGTAPEDLVVNQGVTHSVTYLISK